MEAGLWYVKLYCYTIFSSIPSIKSEYFVIIGLAMNNTTTNYTTQTQPTLTGIKTIPSPTTTIGETTTTITPYERPTIDYPTIIIVILLIAIGVTAFLIFRKKLFLIFFSFFYTNFYNLIPANV
jgi:beta-lactamase regulating signal transducer with metallopeptidase domain